MRRLGPVILGVNVLLAEEPAYGCGSYCNGGLAAGLGLATSWALVED